MEHPATSPQMAARIVRLCLEQRQNVLLVGRPGIGKTDIVMAAAMELSWPLETLHGVSILPEEPAGIPMPNADHTAVDWIPSALLKRMLETTKPLVVFLDDFGQASPAVQAALMQWLLGRRINNHVISELVRFVAASNRKESSMGVSGLLAPVKGRFAQILNVEPSADDWAVWAIQAGLPLEGIAFARFRPEYLEAYKPTGDFWPEASPRTITRALEWYASIRDEALMLPMLANAAGAAWATEFLAFCRVWRSLPDVEAIVNSPDTAQVPGGDKLDVLYAVTTALAAKAKPANLAALMRYIDRLPVTFGAIFVKDCAARSKALAGHGAVTQWVTKHPELMS